MFINKDKNWSLNMFNIIQVLNNLCYLQSENFDIKNKYCLKYYKSLTY